MKRPKSKSKMSASDKSSKPSSHQILDLTNTPERSKGKGNGGGSDVRPRDVQFLKPQAGPHVSISGLKIEKIDKSAHAHAAGGRTTGNQGSRSKKLKERDAVGCRNISSFFSTGE